MRHVKAETDSISSQTECGLKFKDSDVRFSKGDRIVCYTMEEVDRECDWTPPGF